MTELTEELLAELKEAFDLFDKGQTNRIKTSDLPLVVRALNQNPTEAELEEMKREVDPENTGKISFADFTALITKRLKDVDAEEELLEAFQVFDKDRTGYIQSAELKHMLSNMGENFTEEEAEDLLRRANPDETGQIAYEPFIKLITRRFT